MDDLDVVLTRLLAGGLEPGTLLQAEKGIRFQVVEGGFIFGAEGASQVFHCSLSAAQEGPVLSGS
jgi:hypothetical protein